MAPDAAEWRPGSFTKNYSWGPHDLGLVHLYEAIRVGFGDKLENVPREEFRARLHGVKRPDYIPMNFFLFNKNEGGVDYVIADELVFQALSYPHSKAFDRIALFAFNLSMVGVWQGAKPYQRWPALWANHYIRDRVARDLGWDTKAIDADDIEKFVKSDVRYVAEGARKLATNLNYLYIVGGLPDFSNPTIHRWWVDCLFLALDREIEDRNIDKRETPESVFGSLLEKMEFTALTGPRSLEKELASRHLTALYVACGGRERFSNEEVRELTALRLPDVEWLLANDDRPQAALHPTNPRILKTIPRACAMLAKYAGFEVLDADEFATFSSEEFIRRRTRSALKNLGDRKVMPKMSSEELTRLTRDK